MFTEVAKESSDNSGLLTISAICRLLRINLLSGAQCRRPQYFLRDKHPFCQQRNIASRRISNSFYVYHFLALIQKEHEIM